MLYRLYRLVIKELHAILGNAQGRKLLIMPVILQTLIFPFAATLEVKNSCLAIYNADNGAAAQAVMQRLAQAAAFPEIILLHSEQELQQSIDTQQALLALRFPADFSRKLQQRQTAEVQIIIDGRRSNSGQIASMYASQIINAYAAQRNGQLLTPLSVRNLYNPNLDYKWHVLPSLVAIITTVGCLVVTALSVAREREEGTFDQLLVSPLTPAYIMAGKAIPGILVALVQGGFIALIAIVIYGVPFTGSIVLLLAGMVSYGLSLAGVGLFISSFATTQQQAFLGVFFFMVPAVILSGYVSPIENMPEVLQWLAKLNPLTHFIVILKGVFLKSFGLQTALPYLQNLLQIALVTLSIAWLFFRHHLA